MAHCCYPDGLWRSLDQVSVSWRLHIHTSLSGLLTLTPQRSSSLLPCRHSAERVTAGLRESLQRLQLDYVDLIQCHDIEFTQLDQARLVIRLLRCFCNTRRSVVISATVQLAAACRCACKHPFPLASLPFHLHHRL